MLTVSGPRKLEYSLVCIPEFVFVLNNVSFNNHTYTFEIFYSFVSRLLLLIEVGFSSIFMLSSREFREFGYLLSTFVLLRLTLLL